LLTVVSLYPHPPAAISKLEVTQRGTRLHPWPRAGTRYSSNWSSS
jgi:hypothetical protein